LTYRYSIGSEPSAKHFGGFALNGQELFLGHHCNSDGDPFHQDELLRQKKLQLFTSTWKDSFHYVNKVG